ncbi:hydantoinase B/oxoprolinase family protein [Rhizobium leguminosarum]|uniref:hydantoinase B/oxoprolinase family protein n=1 Tax=Rhizobium leguminosarum TaxID=384 RepID=UPI001FEF65BB|nr:hydantoinase B/oxoprolinase family protein [Rhizobium leguminosarum]
MNIRSDMQNNTPSSKVDPITLEIVRSGLVLTAEQINARIIRSATSILVKEMEDCSAALFDERGRLLAESASVPIHLNAIGSCLRTIIDHYLPLDQWNEGDVVLTNDPYAGPESLSSHHTNDVIAYTPIFWNGKMVAISALTVHHIDVGSMWMACRGWGVEIEQEGFRVPPVKIVRDGVLDEQLLRLMVNNSRLRDSLDNDLRAQLSSIALAKDDIHRLFDRYGDETMRRCFQELIDYSERRTREEISKFRDGVYTHEEFILEDGSMGGPFKLALKMTVRGDEIEFDFTGTDPQVRGPINAPLSATYAATFYAMRCVTDANIPNTEGSKVPIRIIAEPGTLVNCRWPAACNQRMVVCHSIVDLVMGAIQASAPERSMGDSCGCSYNDLVATDLVTGERVHFGEIVPGGLGATSLRDGASALSCHVTNCPIPPLEATEMENPVLYLQRELVVDSGGAGGNRGGLGLALSYEVRADNPQLNHTSQKSKIPPQGALGGRPGKSGSWFINKGAPEERELSYAIGDLEYLKKGDIVTQITPGGGGYGDPLERDVGKVVEDVREGFVSVEKALTDYGVEIDPRSLSIVSVQR